MKKIILSIAIVIITLNLSAQITLTSTTSAPQVGDSFSYVTASYTVADRNLSGANKTWDFSLITGPSLTLNLISVSSSLLPYTFPAANIVESFSSGENYYINSSSGRAFVGHNIPSSGAVATYSDPKEIIKFPITYNDVYNETFVGNINGFDINGTAKITGDGYGNLILPYTTVNNVLKVKCVYDYTYSYMGLPYYIFNDTICMWYNSTTRNQIASSTVAYMNGSLYQSQSTYIAQSSLVGTNEVNALDQSVSFYPNPATDYIVVKNESNKVVSINILDAKGILVKKEIVENSLQINVSDLNPGNYIIQYTNEDNSCSEKLIIK